MATASYPDYYRVLRIDPDAEPEIVMAAYRKLASKYHPDINSSPEAAQQMKEINAAYEVLGDAEQRAAYDRTRRLAPRAADAPRSAPASNETSMQGFVRSLFLMVISGFILNVVMNEFFGPGGRWMTIVVVVALLLWKGGAIMRWFGSTR